MFQLDGVAMRALLRQMKPDSFEDISAVLALYRPGPMGVNSHTNYAERKNGRQTVDYIHPELEEPLKEVLDVTYGLIVYQEQVQRIAQIVAGYTLGAADLLRRAMGKKKPEILDEGVRALQRGHARARLLGGGDQGPLGHAGALRGLRVQQGAHGVVRDFVVLDRRTSRRTTPPSSWRRCSPRWAPTRTSRRFTWPNAGAWASRVLPPDVNDSYANFSAVGTDVRFGLTAVRNVGANVVAEIVQRTRGTGRFTSFADFLYKVPASVCNKRTIDSLVKAGAFDSLGHTRRALNAIHERRSTPSLA